MEGTGGGTLGSTGGVGVGGVGVDGGEGGVGGGVGVTSGLGGGGGVELEDEQAIAMALESNENATAVRRRFIEKPSNFAPVGAPREENGAYNNICGGSSLTAPGRMLRTASPRSTGSAGQRRKLTGGGVEPT